MECPHTRILKLYNPSVDRIYVCKSKVRHAMLGSGELADIQLTLVSLDWQHIQIDFDQRMIRILGADVYVDDALAERNSEVFLGPESLVKVHGIVFGVYNTTEKDEERTERIMLEGRKLKKSPPSVEMNYCKCKLEEAKPIGSQSSAEAFEEKMICQFEEAMERAYEGAIGEIGNIPLPEESRKKVRIEEGVDPLSTIVVEETKKEIIKELDIDPKPEIVEAFINKKIDGIEEEINDALNATPDIGIRKQEPVDLGRVLINKEILQQAKRDIGSSSLESDSNTGQEKANGEGISTVVAEALENIDAMKKNITDNIKDEIRNDVDVMVQDEVKERIKEAVNECINTPEMAERIAEKVAGKINGEMLKAQEIESGMDGSEEKLAGISGGESKESDNRDNAEELEAKVDAAEANNSEDLETKGEAAGANNSEDLETKVDAAGAKSNESDNITVVNSNEKIAESNNKSNVPGKRPVRRAAAKKAAAKTAPLAKANSQQSKRTSSGDSKATEKLVVQKQDEIPPKRVKRAAAKRIKK